MRAIPIHPAKPLRALLTRAAVALLFVWGATACAVTHEDIDTWTGTVRGPGKIVAVLLADKYDDELRVHAASALIRMERDDVDGVAELQNALSALPEDTRRRIVDGMTPQLLEMMRGGDTPVPEGTAPPAALVRAKDASFLLLQYASAPQQQQLIEGVVRWFVVDFNGRSLSGSFSAEQVIRQLGAPAASILVDAMTARIPASALVKICELIAQLGNDETKTRAATRMVEIEREMEDAPFGQWLTERIRAQAATQSRTLTDAQIAAAVELNREQFINDGAMPAFHHLADQQVVSERLLAIGVDPRTDAVIVERRVHALQAMEGHVRPEQWRPLLTLALDQATPARVRDYAFDRIADSHSREAVPSLWPLATQDGSARPDAWRERWRVGTLLLTLGGAEVVQEWFSRLPSATARREPTRWAREELHGYAERLSQTRPEQTAVARAQLASSDWFDQAIALYYFERVGTEADLPQIQAMASSTTATAGEHWEEHDTIGKIATDVVTAIRERVSGAAAGAGAGAGAGAAAAGGGAPAAGGAQ